MPVSADTTQIAIVQEATYGVTPASPTWLIMPITGESLVATANSELSATLNADRQSDDSFLNGIEPAGSLDFEFAKSPAMTLLLESAMGKATATSTTDRTLTVGLDQISFTVEKRWPDPNTPGSYLYHRYPGCVANTMTLTFTAGTKCTGSCGLIGQALVTDDAVVAASTYPPITEFNVFRGPDVTQIELDNAGGTLLPTLTDSCVTDIVINLNNNYRGVQCLGTLGNKETVIGKFECNYTQTIFFSSNELMDNFISQDIVDEIITVGDNATDDYYTFTTTKGKIAANDVVAGGEGTDVVNANTINWLNDKTLGTPTTIEILTSEGL